MTAPVPASAMARGGLLPPARTGFYRRRGKRMFDLAVTAPAIVVLSPLFAILAAVVRFDLGSPVLFRQVRPGFNGNPFTLLKFRSMTHAVDADGNRLPDDSPEAYTAARAGQRQTKVGEKLRRTSVDELPELFNVLAGQMSLVGPRPLLCEYLPRYTPEQMRRHDVLPGLTGWAQVQGRQALSYEDRFRLDVWYVENCTFLLDVRILAHTVWDVLRQRGTSEPGLATGSEFMGSREHAEANGR